MATASLTPFIPESNAYMADQALKLAVKTMARAHNCAVLWFQDILRRKLYRQLGYASIYLYADRELGFSTSKTGDFLRLAGSLDSLPQLKKEMEAGRIGYTKAREIIKVAGPENEALWLDEARNNPRRELVIKVAQARKAASARRKENPDQGQLLSPPEPATPPW